MVAVTKICICEESVVLKIYVPRKSETLVEVLKMYKTMTICFHLLKPAWPSKCTESLKTARKSREAFYPSSPIMQI